MPAALVTGGAARLGRAMALYLADRGFDVGIHYKSNKDAARDVVALIEEKGRKAVALKADLLDEAQTENLMPAASSALGASITVLINNASIFEYDTVHTATKESWDRHLGSNLRAPFVLTQAMAGQVPDPSLDEMGEPVATGLIINMVDQRVRNLTPEFMTYTIAKMGLWRSAWLFLRFAGCDGAITVC